MALIRFFGIFLLLFIASFVSSSEARAACFEYYPEWYSLHPSSFAQILPGGTIKSANANGGSPTTGSLNTIAVTNSNPAHILQPIPFNNTGCSRTIQPKSILLGNQVINLDAGDWQDQTGGSFVYAD